MKLKKKPILREARHEKILLAGETLDAVESYAVYYEEIHHEKIAHADLIIEMISAFVNSDRDFKKWRLAKQFAKESVDA